MFNKHEPNNLLVRQAQHEVLQEQLELPRLRKTLTRMRSGEVLHCPTTGPLAFPLLVERLNNRMNGESVLERIERMQKDALRHEGESVLQRTACKQQNHHQIETKETITDAQIPHE